MEPFRPDWNSNVGLPATPFFCKTSVRYFGSLLVAIGAASISLAKRDIRPLVHNSLFAVSALGIAAAVLARLFPSKLEQSSLLRMRREVGERIEQGNLGFSTIRLQFAEALRLGAITDSDCDLLVSADLVKYDFKNINVRHDLVENIQRLTPNLIATLNQRYLDWKLGTAKSLGEICYTNYALKSGIKKADVLPRYIELKLKDLEAPGYTLSKFLEELGPEALCHVEKSRPIQNKIAQAINSGEIKSEPYRLGLIQYHLKTNKAQYLEPFTDGSVILIADQFLPERIVGVHSQLRQQIAGLRTQQKEMNDLSNQFEAQLVKLQSEFENFEKEYLEKGKILDSIPQALRKTPPDQTLIAKTNSEIVDYQKYVDASFFSEVHVLAKLESLSKIFDQSCLAAQAATRSQAWLEYLLTFYPNLRWKELDNAKARVSYPLQQHPTSSHLLSGLKEQCLKELELQNHARAFNFEKDIYLPLEKNRSYLLAQIGEIKTQLEILKGKLESIQQQLNPLLK